jgi:RNA-directed DNA polymerase
LGILFFTSSSALRFKITREFERGQGTWDFALRDGMRLKHHDEVPVRRHIKVRSTKSPFDGDWSYWKRRERRQSAYS